MTVLGLVYLLRLKRRPDLFTAAKMKKGKLVMAKITPITL